MQLRLDQKDDDPSPRSSDVVGADCCCCCCGGHAVGFLVAVQQEKKNEVDYRYFAYETALFINTYTYSIYIYMHLFEVVRVVGVPLCPTNIVPSSRIRGRFYVCTRTATGVHGRTSAPAVAPPSRWPIRAVDGTGRQHNHNNQQPS